MQFLTNLLKLLRQCSRIFQNFVEETVSSKITFGHIECCFDHSFKKFLPNFNDLFAQIAWKTMCFLRNRWIYPKISSGHAYRAVFKNGRTAFWPKSSKELIKTRTNFQKYFFLQDTHFPQKCLLYPLNAVLTNLSKVFLPKFRELCAINPKIFKKIENLLRKVFSSEILCGKMKYSFDNRTDLFSPKLRKIFHKVWKQLKNIKFLEKKSITSEFSSGHKESSFDHLVKKLHRIPNIFLQIPLKAIFFSMKKVMLCKKFPWTR